MRPGAASPPIASIAIQITQFVMVRFCVLGSKFWVQGSRFNERTWNRSRLFFFNGTNLPCTVVPAVRAHAVRRLGFVTVRALAEPDCLQSVVSTALGGARFGVSSFWIRHRLRTLSSSFADSSRPQSVDLPSCAGNRTRRD